jgi:hypothetical protein
VHLLRGGIKARSGAHERLKIAFPVDVGAWRRHVDQILVAEDGALARLGQDDELVGQVPADRAGVGAHGYGFSPMRSKVFR